MRHFADESLPLGELRTRLTGPWTSTVRRNLSSHGSQAVYHRSSCFATQVPAVPQQHNGSDCGLFTLASFEQLALGVRCDS